MFFNKKNQKKYLITFQKAHKQLDDNRCKVISDNSIFKILKSLQNNFSCEIISVDLTNSEHEQCFIEIKCNEKDKLELLEYFCLRLKNRIKNIGIKENQQTTQSPGTAHAERRADEE